MGMGLRALEVNGYREDAEKSGVWTANMNLENMLGDRTKVGCPLPCIV